MNLITLCRYCHGNVHGVHLSELVIEPEEVEQACVEYVSDMYALIPWDGEISLDYSDPGEKDIAFQLIDIGVRYLRGVPPMWSGTTYDNG